MSAQVALGASHQDKPFHWHRIFRCSLACIDPQEIWVHQSMGKAVRRTGREMDEIMGYISRRGGQRVNPRLTVASWSRAPGPEEGFRDPRRRFTRWLLLRGRADEADEVEVHRCCGQHRLRCAAITLKGQRGDGIWPSPLFADAIR
jgi:hypothetical protein